MSCSCCADYPPSFTTTMAINGQLPTGMNTCKKRVWIVDELVPSRTKYNLFQTVCFSFINFYSCTRYDCVVVVTVSCTVYGHRFGGSEVESGQRTNHDHPIFISIRTFSESRKLNTSSFSSLFSPSLSFPIALAENIYQYCCSSKYRYLTFDILPFERYHAITLRGTTYKIEE